MRVYPEVKTAERHALKRAQERLGGRRQAESETVGRAFEDQRAAQLARQEGDVYKAAIYMRRYQIHEFQLPTGATGEAVAYVGVVGTGTLQ